MKKILVALMFLPFLGLAQTTATATEESAGGMKFEQGSWKEILAKAKAENKYIIMDCMTTWCGPCKHMDKNIFPLKESGDFYNANYLAVKVQFDSTANDDERVKSWKKDMKAIEKEYSVNAYPTYLIFDPNGNIVHRSVGATMQAKEFVSRGKDGMNPETQYYTQLRKYEGGQRDPEFLKRMAGLARSAYDLKKASVIADEYLASQTDLFTPENVKFIASFTTRSSDKGFGIALNNADKINAVLGENKAQSMVLAIVMQEDVYSEMSKAIRAKTSVDWDAVAAKLNTKYPTLAEEALAKGKLGYYQSTKDWNNFQAQVVSYMDKYGAKVSPSELNSYAWAVFENCKDMTCVTQALDWSKRSFKDNNEPMYMDTYANILHKLGKTKEAIEVQEKAIALTKDESSKKSLQDGLDKMKKGEKTWSDK